MDIPFRFPCRNARGIPIQLPTTEAQHGSLAWMTVLAITWQAQPWPLSTEKSFCEYL